MFSSTISLDTPKGVAINPDLKQILICDSANNRVVLATMQGIKNVDTLSTLADSSAMTNPNGCFYHKGYYYVSVEGRHVVIRLRAHDLAHKGQFGTAGTSGSSTSLLDTPKAITTDGRYLYICDKGNSRIMKLNLTELTYYSKSGTSIGGISLSTMVGIVYKKTGGEAVFVYVTGYLIKCKTNFSHIENVAVSSGLFLTNDSIGIGFDDDYVYVPDTSVINVYASDGLTLLTTITDSVTSVTGYRGILFVSDATQVHIRDAYRPRDSYTQSTAIKVGGDFFSNPFIILGEDTLVVGTSAEDSPNNWKEENRSYTGNHYVEEASVSSSWTEE